MKKVMVSIAIVLLVSAVSGCITTNLEQQIEKYDLNLSMQSKLIVDNINGYVSFQASDEETLKVQEFAKGVDALAVAEVLNEMDIQMKEENSELHIIAKVPSPLPRGVLSVGFNLIIKTNNNHVLLKTSNGNIDIQSFNGILAGRNSNGDISVMGATGELDLNSSNGGIYISDFGGLSLSAVTSNGPIQVETDRGISDVILETVNGDIDFISSADVSVDNYYGLDTSNSDISIQLPADSGLNIDATTTNGQIYCEYTGLLTIEDHYLETINGGGAILNLETSNGNIDILSF